MGYLFCGEKFPSPLRDTYLLFYEGLQEGRETASAIDHSRLAVCFTRALEGT